MPISPVVHHQQVRASLPKQRHLMIRFPLQHPAISVKIQNRPCVRISRRDPPRMNIPIALHRNMQVFKAQPINRRSGRGHIRGRNENQPSLKHHQQHNHHDVSHRDQPNEPSERSLPPLPRPHRQTALHAHGVSPYPQESPHPTVQPQGPRSTAPPASLASQPTSSQTSALRPSENHCAEHLPGFSLPPSYPVTLKPTPMTLLAFALFLQDAATQVPTDPSLGPR